MIYTIAQKKRIAHHQNSLSSSAPHQDTPSTHHNSQRSSLGLSLEPASLNVLLCDNRVGIDNTLLDTDVALSVSVELAALGEVEVDGVGPGDGEEGQWDAHGLAGSDDIGNIAQDGGTDSTTADGCDQEGGSALGVATETTECQGEDNGEDAGLEEEHNHEHAETAPVRSGG